MARHIATVASRLFSAHGYDATPVRTICEAAGVTKPTLYYHFGSKEGLAQALLTRPLAGLLDELQRLMAEPLAPEAFLAEVLERHFAFLREDPDRGRFLFTLVFGPSESSLATEVQRFREQFHGLMHEALERLSAVERVDESRRGRCSQAIRGLLLSAMADHLYCGQPLEPGLGQQLIHDLLVGFGGEATPGPCPTVGNDRVARATDAQQ
jgi:AcrR family transcriptional regulator